MNKLIYASLYPRCYEKKLCKSDLSPAVSENKRNKIMGKTRV